MPHFDHQERTAWKELGPKARLAKLRHLTYPTGLLALCPSLSLLPLPKIELVLLL
jgi:hypothetical protein